MAYVLIHNQTHPADQPLRARLCDSFFCRLRGLMFQKSLAPHEGLLMVQPTSNRVDAAIHMLFMAFDITVVWLDPQLKVVDTCHALRWRPAYMPSAAAKYILEAHPDRLKEFHTGDQVILEKC